MKNRLLHILLFLIILIITDQLIGTAISFFSQKQIRDNRIGLLLDGQINSDIIIVGSSRALNNYNPEIISDATGRSCYNFGLSGSNILYHEAIINLMIHQNKKPSLIIYSVDDHATFYEIPNIIFRKDVLYPFVYDDEVNKFVSLQLKKNTLATKFSKTYRENMNFVNALKFPIYGQEIVDYKTNHLDRNGANLLIMRKEDPPATFRNLKINVDNLHISLKYWASFRRIQENCQKTDIKIIFVLPPVYINGYPGFKKILDEAVLNDSPVYDYTNSISDSTLFFNGDHLNNKGADWFTQNLTQHLKEHKR